MRQQDEGSGMGQAMQMIQMMMGLQQQQGEQQMAQEQQPLQMDLLRERIMGEQQQRQPDAGRQNYYASQQNANDMTTISQMLPQAMANPALMQELLRRYPQLNIPTARDQVAAKAPDPGSEAIRQRAQQMMMQQQTQGGY